MDLYAYANIGNVEKIAELNGISVPRLRGYRLMRDEEIINIDDLISDGNKAYIARTLIEAGWNPHSWCYTLDSKTNAYKRYYLNYHYENGVINYDSIRWERIHGKHRKILKFEIKKYEKAIINQYKIFNKYVGRPDILYIHARIGGGNWIPYGGPELESKPWFIEKVDDSDDRTYCDIYAKIDKFPDGVEE